MLKIKTLRAASVAIGFCGLLAPSVAQAGFFDQLFGGLQAPAPQPVPTYDYGSELPPSVRIVRPHHRKHVAVVDEKAGRQTPTDLMHDATLRPGDAVMMKSGIHIYEGDRAKTHESDEFVALDDADTSRKERDELLALDTTRNDPLRHGAVAPDTIASGRSASVSTPINVGYRITDAHGKSVRYVGP